MKPHLLTAVLLAALAGCNRSGPVATPTSPTSPAPGAAASVMAVTLRGNARLTGIGESTPLTATASFSDGTSQNVTAVVEWVSSNAACITVSPGGMLTVLGFGQSYISAAYQGKSGTLNVQATPSGSFVAWGRVREPGDGGLAGVRVREASSGRSALSDANGEFSLGGLTGLRLIFERDGYERAALEAQPGIFTDAAMQRVIRIAAGSSIEVGFAPHDVSHDLAGGLRCSPCKMIRVVNAEAGRLRLKASWTEPRAALHFWVNGRLFEGTAPAGLEVLAEVAIDAPGELVVYVGLKNAADYYAPFTLSTVAVK